MHCCLSTDFDFKKLKKGGNDCGIAEAHKFAVGTRMVHRRPTV